MQVPSRFNTVPVLIQQLAEGLTTGTLTHKDNARRTLTTIKEFIEWALKQYPEDVRSR